MSVWDLGLNQDQEEPIPWCLVLLGSDDRGSHFLPSFQLRHPELGGIQGTPALSLESRRITSCEQYTETEEVVKGQVAKVPLTLWWRCYRLRSSCHFFREANTF